MSHERWQGTGREVAGGEVEGATLALTQDPARVRSVVGGHAAVTGGSWCPLWTVDTAHGQNVRALGTT